MDYRIYPFEDQSRLDEICALFATGLGDSTPEEWKWKHFSDNGMPKSMMLVAEADDGSFAAVFALQPEIYQYQDRTLRIVQAEDLVIAPSHRGSGLMRKLHTFMIHHLTDLGYAGFIGFPNENSLPVLVKYGAKQMPNIGSLNTAKRFLPLYPCRKTAAAGNWAITVCDSMPQDLFYCTNTECYQLTKNDAFMRWRFVDNPHEQFRWLTIRKAGVLMGYMVFCITAGRFRRAVNICDWALQDAVDTPALKKAVQVLRSWGNWASLWGQFSEEASGRWIRAGLSNQQAPGTHLLLHSFAKEPLPENFHLTRADLDY